MWVIKHRVELLICMLRCVVLCCLFLVGWLVLSIAPLNAAIFFPSLSKNYLQLCVGYLMNKIAEHLHK